LVPEETLRVRASRSLRFGLVLALMVLGSLDGDARAQFVNPSVTIETSLGSIEVELFARQAPISVQNFLAYQSSGFFDGTICHRVITDFMIQCGGFTADMNKKETRPAIKNEANNGLKNQRGALAMARMPAVDSATAQFFINLQDNEFLDHGANDFGYAVFGRVINGMDVVDKIASVATAPSKGHANVPTVPVVLETVSALPGS
jgi:peptidyl-prolyl cis-trans isomerase A (cyclophilin A)